MKYIYAVLLVTFLLAQSSGFCQEKLPERRESAPVEAPSSAGHGSFLFYAPFYPVNTDPYVGYKSPMYSKEKILFEASPEVRINFFNNIYSGLNSNHKHTQAYYIHFRPVIRMYIENSKPVKTPSTPILFGAQHLWVDHAGGKETNFKMYALSLESGHYSNGQSGGAFTEEFEDGSLESEAKYNEIKPETNLSELLNRKSGNFSTNLTELKGNVRFITTDSNDYMMREIHTITLGGTLYHNLLFGIADVGGFTENDIKIYGRFRSLAMYEYMLAPDSWKGKKFTISESFEYIHGAHPWVEPMRFDTKFTIYPFPKMLDLGFVLSHTWGHDNYNYRFVDHGHQVGFGVTWSVFPQMIIRPPYH